MAEFIAAFEVCNYNNYYQLFIYHFYPTWTNFCKWIVIFLFAFFAFYDAQFCACLLSVVAMRTNYVTICLRIYSDSFDTWVLIVVKDFSKFAFINFKINKTSKFKQIISECKIVSLIFFSKIQIIFKNLLQKWLKVFIIKIFYAKTKSFYNCTGKFSCFYPSFI